MSSTNKQTDRQTNNDLLIFIQQHKTSMQTHWIKRIKGRGKSPKRHL